MTKKKRGNIKEANVVKDEVGRQYHIGLAEGELAENIILVGDPARPNLVKDVFSKIHLETQVREYHTITGRIGNLDISIMSTGIGPGNVEIAIVEIMQVCKSPTIIRAGSCGGLQPFINVGDLVISTGSVRLENTSNYFVPDGYPAIASYEVVLGLSEAAKRKKLPYHIGLSASASGFYGAQGREIPGIPVRNPTFYEELAKVQVYNMEMEASVLFNLAQILKYRAGMVCTVFANRTTNEFIPNEFKHQSEINCVDTAIDALQIIHQMDKVMKENKVNNWIPSFSIE
ncbi:MAG: nucleoside phosphorylase [Candidatus Hodarchaeales archaeon]|jgi:uridine phosphorylase